MAAGEQEERMQTSLVVEKARLLAEQGFRVFPLAANGKKPATAQGLYSASTKTVQFRAYWDRSNPCNIAIATGKGLVVIDVDVKKGRPGLSALNQIQNEYGKLPSTLQSSTPTGGIHLYYYYPTNAKLRNRANLYPGIDVRADGGYVVAPPSVIDGKPYRWMNEHPIADAPAWLVELIGQRRSKTETGVQATQIDGAPAIDRARNWLRSHAPAVEGAGGDHHTFVTAAMLKDFGVSAPTALELMLDHWNDRCSPPWSPDELHTKIENAYAYGENAVGALAPEAFFQDDDILQRSREREKAQKLENYNAIKPNALRSLKPSPPRKWVLGDFAIEGKITVLVAPGGVGKSTLTLNMALAVATGREDIMDMQVRPWLAKQPGDLAGDAEIEALRNENRRIAASGAWVFNNEDDQDELNRRLHAAMQLHSVTPDDLADDLKKPRMFVNSGENRPLTIARRVAKGKNRSIEPGDVDAVIEHIRDNQIKMFVVDPFVETHQADENDNVEIAKVMQFYRRIAQQADCAVVIVHHTRKPPQGQSDGFAGYADGARGASAVINAARIVKTLYGMSERDAREMGVTPAERWKYVRLDDAKANLSVVRSGRDAAAWFERVPVTVETAIGGVRESVGALKTCSFAAASLSAADTDESKEAERLRWAGAARVAVEALREYGGAADSPVSVARRDVIREMQARSDFTALSYDQMRYGLENAIGDGKGFEDGGELTLIKHGDGRKAQWHVHLKMTDLFTD